MRYKREEAFRFQFQKPIQGMIKVLKENGANVDTPETPIDIMDISPNGLRFKSSLNLAIHEKSYLLEISLEIDNRNLHILGQPIWKKTMGVDFFYGFEGMDNKGTKQEIIETLKDYSKKIKRNQNL
ncbi:hypothetical protein KDN24_21400 [Bacillus sp. Bva_UNVM-123]|uniref:hypothetical protein n=1 Tax=Bacillus sp. Bva_UNVM-123 TaxID=2829798 RepID=UPI00391F908F